MRELILRAARSVFARSGYHDATLQRIAQEAGVTRPAISHHFSSKAALFSAVFEEVRQRVVVTGIHRALDASTHLQDRLATFLMSSVEVDAEDRSYAAFITASLLDTARSPELHHLTRRHLDDLRAFLRRLCEDAVTAEELPASTDIATSAEALLAIVWGTGLYSAYLGDHQQLTAVSERVVAMVRGLLTID